MEIKVFIITIEDNTQRSKKIESQKRPNFSLDSNSFFSSLLLDGNNTNQPKQNKKGINTRRMETSITPQAV